MRKLAILMMLVLLAPTVQASNPTSELSLMVTYDEEVQSIADLIIENKMNDEILEIDGAYLFAPVDISAVSPSIGDVIKITAILDPNDPTKIRTICIIFLGNQILHTIQMASNVYDLGTMDVENTGNPIDWDTQNLVMNFPSATSTTPATGPLNGYVEFKMNYDRNDNWKPPCDEGWTWEATFELTIQDPNQVDHSDSGYLASIDNTNKLHDGGFCSDNPDPSETEEEDPELIVRIYGPGGLVPVTEAYHAFASIRYNSKHYAMEINANGDEQMLWDGNSNHLDAYGPQCTPPGWCYHTIEIAWS